MLAIIVGQMAGKVTKPPTTFQGSDWPWVRGERMHPGVDSLSDFHPRVDLLSDLRALMDRIVAALLDKCVEGVGECECVRG